MRSAISDLREKAVADGLLCASETTYVAEVILKSEMPVSGTRNIGLAAGLKIVTSGIWFGDKCYKIKASD